MRWINDHRRETEWKEWFAWTPVEVETTFTGHRFCYGNEAFKTIWWERIERRKMALPNADWTYVYRIIGSDWDVPKMSEKPPPPKTRLVTEGSLTPGGKP